MTSSNPTGRIALAVALSLVCAGAVLRAQRFGAVLAPQPEPLRFRYMGPPSAGRIAAVAGVPGDTTTYYAGAASGGVWKSVDSGRTFQPVFDEQPVQAIGALAVAPSDPKIVWAGTGEAWAIRDSDVMGDGVYKSTDAGLSWQHMGLPETGRIGRIIVHPTDPNTVWVCALGRTTGPQQERGVFETTDGGKTWRRSLFADPNTGCSGLSMDAHDPNVLLAGMWQVEMHTWAELSGGPGSAVYLTRDGGATWKKLETGLPKSPVGKIDVAIAPSNPSRMYALIQTASQGSVWRSDDAGGAWRVVSWDRTLIGRAGYYIRIAVSPTNPDEVLVANSSFHRSLDGGLTFPITDRGCGDCHDIWMDPKNPDHWVQTGDSGMGITTNHAQSFTSVQLPIGQMYHVAVDRQVPYWIYSNRQDDGTMRGPSDAPVRVPSAPSYAGITGAGSGTGVPVPPRRFGAEAPVPWQAGLGGCESGFTLPADPDHPDVVWASCYGNQVTRWDARTGRARSVSPWIHTLDSPPNEVKYRCHWTPPLAVDPFDHKSVYYGCQVVFKTSDEGQTWKVISPDLSTQDPSRIVSSGGIVGDNLGQFYGEVVFAIAPSDAQQGLIWAGTNDGKVWYTKDGGGSWVDVTKNIAGLPAWGTVRKIEPSHFDPATAYVAIDFHLMDNRDPFIYKTADFGQTWTKISGGLPSGHALDYAMAITENPNRRGMLFAGTGHGFFYSMDDGGHWTAFKDGLPAAPVSWITVQKDLHDVVVSTYGRGLFVLKDITRLEQADKVPANTSAYLYAPHAGFRQARSGSVDLLYRLAAADAGTVSFEVADASGTVVRRFTAHGQPGLNKAVWDLRYDAPVQVALRTTPPDNPVIWNEPRFKGKATRPIVHWGIEQAMVAGPIAAPGKYTVRMRVKGQTLTQTADVLKDPAIASPDADLLASTKAQVRVRDDMDAAAGMINRLEVMRKSVEDQRGKTTKPGAVKLLDDIGHKLMAAELHLLSRTDLHSDDKWYVEKYKIYMNLIWLNGEIGTGAGDVAGGADYKPTAASLEVLDGIEKDLAAAKDAFDRVVNVDVPAFNTQARGAGLRAIALEDRAPSAGR
ncbi:MAG: WD40/YVTN/BNR-like repeat-containing protein [Betaproteobacteria bacterium]